MSKFPEKRVSLETRISAIEARNARVELDKAWETSITRKVWILGITYILTAITFWIIGVDAHLRHAIIPTFAYFLSTLSLPIARRMWQKRFSRENKAVYK
ncbi:MAG: hypothetical protein AAGG02_04900 [Cyanobacteria bacterium P01_H01_bin.15]